MITGHLDHTQWKFSVETITPERAKDILEKCNRGNRNLRPGVVAKYAKIIDSGNWRLSPEAIVISDTGRLLNGQHRLSAVARADRAVPFLVIYGPEESTFEVLDRGAGRSAADALGANKKATEVARLACMLEAGQANKVADYNIRHMLDLIEAEHDALMSSCNTASPLFSSAPFRLSAVARVIGGADRGDVHDLYRALVLGHTDELPPIGHAVMRLRLSGRLSGSSEGGSLQSKLLCVAWDLFSPDKKYNSRIVPRQYSSVRDSVLEAINNAKS